MFIKFTSPPLRINQIIKETPINIMYKKTINYIKLYKGSIKMEPIIDAYPARLQIDPCNICQLRCPLCPTGGGNKLKLSNAKKLLPFSDFKKLFDEVGDYVFYVDLYGTGEPLLNPSLVEMIKYCKSKGIYVNFSSNLNNFYRHSPEEIIDSGLDKITLSIDGATQETYEKYRVNGILENVLENAEKLVLEKKKKKRKKPYIVWQYLVFKHNIHEINIAKKMARSLSFDAIEFDGPLGLLGANIILDKRDLIKAGERYLPQLNSEYSRYTESYVHKIKKNSCNLLWKQAFIHPNGSVSPCCGVWDEKYSFGNCFKTNFIDVWNNEKYIKSRKIIRAANRDCLSVKNNQCDDSLICQICAKKDNYI
jgi:MoaA/NifB/PqqE/SkfB family radical SAM enzyme